MIINNVVLMPFIWAHATPLGKQQPGAMKLLIGAVVLALQLPTCLGQLVDIMHFYSSSFQLLTPTRAVAPAETPLQGAVTCTRGHPAV